jgi:hypothetical protein
VTGAKPPGHLPTRGLPAFNKKELELLLFEQMAQLEAMRSLLVELKLVSDQEFDFLVKKASQRVMERMVRDGLAKTVQVFPGSSAEAELREEGDDKKR